MSFTRADRRLKRESLIYQWKNGKSNRVFRQRCLISGQERKKKIHRLHMNMADTSNARITVSYVTEKGTMDDVYELSMSGTGAMVGRMLTPGVSRVCRFGVLVSSAGAIGVDGLVIRYEIGGEAI